MKTILKLCSIGALFFQFCNGMGFREDLPVETVVVGEKGEKPSFVTNKTGTKLAFYHSGILKHLDVLSKEYERKTKLTDIEELLALSICGNKVICTRQNQGFVYDSQQEKEISKLAERIKLAEFSTDGKQIVTDATRSRILIWDTNSGEKLKTFQLSLRGSIKSCHFDSTAENILASGRQYKVIHCSTLDGQAKTLVEGEPDLGPTAFYTDDSGITHHDPFAYQENENKVAVGKKEFESRQKVRKIFYHGKNLIVTGGQGSDSSLTIFNLEQGSEKLLFIKHVEVLGYNPEHKILISYYIDDNIEPKLLFYDLSKVIKKQQENGH